MARTTSIESFETQNRTYARELLEGIVQIGLHDPTDVKLAYQLGLSLWMRRSSAGMDSLRSTLLELRAALVKAGGLDPATEPVPLLGRSARTDVLNLAAYLSGLLTRSASSAGCGPRDIADRAVDHFNDRIGVADARDAGVTRAV